MRKKIIALFFFCVTSMLAFAQNMTIAGRVTGSDGATVPGVSVLVKGTSLGTNTGLDGDYTISAKKGDILLFSFIGLETKAVEVTDQTVINVALAPDQTVLDEVVVVGYGVMRRSDLTGAVGSIKGDNMNVLSTTNFQSALSGRAAGVQVVSSGSVDGAVKVRIRGVGTINNSDPLYVVDGFPTSDISFIAPNDIESIEVLKDASAAAIYGSRGANGVIMVTTKKGKDQGTKVSANVFAGVRSASKYLDVLDAADYGRARLEAVANGGTSLDINQRSILQYAIDHNSQGTDWQREVLRTGAVRNYNVSVMGGSEKVKYNLSSTYEDENGILKNSFVDKFFLRFNNEYKFSESIRFGSDVSFINYDMSDTDLSNMYSAALTLASRAAPVSPVFDQFGNWSNTMNSDHNAARINDFERYKNKSGNKFVGNFYLLANLYKGLSFKSTYGTDYSFDKYRRYIPVFYVSQNESQSTSELLEQRSNNRSWVWSNVLNYSFNLGEQHKFNTMLGTEATYNRYEMISATAFDVQENEDMRYISAAKSNNYIGKSAQSVSTIFSTFVRANYAYANKYLLTATLRSDASSKFSKANRVGYFPSVSAGWNMREESFLKDIPYVSQLKMRAGWGQVGNQSSAGVGDYLATITNGLKYPLGNNVINEGRTPTVLSNENLKWEVSEQYNVGFDMGFLGGKLTLVADYFIRNTNDMIVRVPIPLYVGANKPLANVGDMSNKGFEFTVGHDNTLGDFKYHVDFNISFIRNKVTSLGRSGALMESVYDGRLDNTSRTEVGHEIAYYYGYRSDGVFNTEEELKAHSYVDANGERHPIQPNASLGDVKFVDLNGNGKIDEGDLTKLGSYMPNFSGGMNIQLNYKNWDMSFFSDFVSGNQIANMTTFDLRASDADKNILQSYYDNRWTPETPNNNQPRLTTGAVYKENSLFSDRYIEDGSFLRLKNIQVGYSLPKELIQKVKLSHARLYFSVDNLYTFTKYSGYNPEISDQWGKVLAAGCDVGGTPLPRTFSFGLNLNF